MAEIKHIKERVYRPDREDIKTTLEKEGIIRGLAYVFSVVSIVGCLYMAFFSSGNSYDIDLLSRILVGFNVALIGGIYMARNRENFENETMTANKESEKYLMNIGYEAKKLKGSAAKTSQVANNLVRPLLFDSEQFKRHMLIMATIGAGKTVMMKGMVEQHAINGGGGLICEGKGTEEAAKEFYALFESIGRADDFIHINFLNMDNTHTINPLLYGNAIAIYEILIALLIGEENQWKEKNKFFMKNILKIAVYKRDNEDLKLDFTTLSRYLTLDKLVDEAILYKEKVYLSAAIDDFVSYVAVVIGMSYENFLEANEYEIKDQYKEQIKAGEQGIYDAGNSAQAWNNVITNLKSDYGRVFNTQNPTISLYEAVQKNKFIFVTLPTMASDTSPKELGRLILGLLKGVAAEKAENSIEPEIPFVCFLDEIGSYIVEGTGRLMAKSRSLGISMIPIFQNPSQIDQVGKIVGSESLERTEIIAVTGTHILMKNIHPETTEFYNKMLEPERILDKDFVEKRDGIKGGIGAEAHFKVEKEEVIKHKDVMAMNNGEMLVFNDGKLYSAIATTESTMQKTGKKLTYEKMNFTKGIPLTQYIPKEKFLEDMVKINQELEKIA